MIQVLLMSGPKLLLFAGGGTVLAGAADKIADTMNLRENSNEHQEAYNG